MSTTLKISQVGNSLGLVLPRELLARMRLGKGDVVHITETPQGLTLSPFDPEVAEQVGLGEEFMREFRDAFRELAK